MRFAFVIFMSLLSFAAFSASFDCSKARSKSEILICGVPELSMEDDELSLLYKRVVGLSKNTDQVRSEAKAAWIDRENKCGDVECLYKWFAERKLSLRNHLAVLGGDNEHHASAEAGITDSSGLIKAIKEVEKFASDRGMTVEELAANLNSSPNDLYALVATSDSMGSPPESTLQSLENLSKFVNGGGYDSPAISPPDQPQDR